MEAFFASGRAADLILLILFGELVWLARRNGFATALSVTAPGFFFVLAIRGALTGAAWAWIATPLAAAGLAHAWDVGRRLKARRPT